MLYRTEKLDRSVKSFESLRSRVGRVFSSTEFARDPRQQSFYFSNSDHFDFELPTRSLSGFIDFLSAAVPNGEVYIFGGMLRDLALYGRRGFNSDIDIVVEGGWDSFVQYLAKIGARRNKFGGYRLFAGDWPIDIWNAEETWAIRQGLVRYSGISSLNETTVLNWDAILMNWRTKNFVCSESYLDCLRNRVLDVVLENNPNPLGMAVRVFRHLSTKDARKIGRDAARYLELCTSSYSFDELVSSEVKSYRSSLIDPALYRFFSLVRNRRAKSVELRFEEAAKILYEEGAGRKCVQFGLF